MLLFLRVIIVLLNMTAALNSADVLVLIIKCVDFAAVKHVYQRRIDPERTPYINHPIGNKIVEQCVIIKCFENKVPYLFEVWKNEMCSGMLLVAVR